jgi:chemotaxis signal transduction protein
LKEESETEYSRIIIIQTDYKLFAFFVERVKEICMIGNDFKDELHFLPYTGKLFLYGILKHKNRSLYMPDFQKIAKDQFLCS